MKFFAICLIVLIIKIELSDSKSTFFTINSKYYYTGQNVVSTSINQYTLS